MTQFFNRSSQFTLIMCLKLLVYIHNIIQNAYNSTKTPNFLQKNCCYVSHVVINLHCIFGCYYYDKFIQQCCQILQLFFRFVLSHDSFLFYSLYCCIKCMDFHILKEAARLRACNVHITLKSIQSFLCLKVHRMN